jgi:integrase
MVERRESELRIRPPAVRVLHVDNTTTEERLRMIFPAALARALRDPSNTAGDLREVLDRLGYGWVHSHTLRKTVATRLDEAGLTAREIADQLGHAKPSLTQDVYLGRKVVSARAAKVLER